MIVVSGVQKNSPLALSKISNERWRGVGDPAYIITICSIRSSRKMVPKPEELVL